MIFIKDSVPKNSLSEMLKTSLPQMAAGIAQQLQQRRQQQNNVFGLQSIGMDPQKAQLASGMDPQMLTAVIKEELRNPMYEAFGRMFGSDTSVSDTSVGGEQGVGQNGIPSVLNRPAPGTKILLVSKILVASP